MKINRLLVLIIIVLIAAFGYLGYEFLNKQQELDTEIQEKALVLKEKQELRDEYTSLLSEYNVLETSNDSLNSEIETRKEKIKELLKQVDVYKGDRKVIDRLKKELVTMRDIMKSYVVQIDSLNQLNQELTHENTRIKLDLSDVSQKYTQTKDINEKLSNKVKLASQLKAYEILGTGIKLKGSSAKETTKANKAEKIKVCFVLSENKVTEKGTKEVYVRIAQPDGAILTKGADDTFTLDGKLLNYSIKERVYYDGSTVDMCTYWKVEKELLEGVYIIDIFVDNAQIGTAEFVLD